MLKMYFERERGIHHEDESHGDGEGSCADMESGDEYGHSRSEKSDGDPRPDGEENPEGQPAVDK